MNKVRFTGDWNNRPRDVAGLDAFVSKELERPLNWQVVNLSSRWTDWMDAPVLYLASQHPPPLSDSEADNLRQFALNGGLLFLQADANSSTFDEFSEKLAKRLFPDLKFADIAPDNPLNRSMYKLSQPTMLRGVWNGSRLLMVESPVDISRSWHVRNSSTRPEDFRIGANVFVYAAGRTNLRNKLRTSVVPDPTGAVARTIPVTRLSYDGAWDPEPAAWPRVSRMLQTRTGLQPVMTETAIDDLRPGRAAVAVLTGTADTRFDDSAVKTVRDFCQAGGVLLVDACGGSVPFASSVRDGLLDRAFPKADWQRLSVDDPILSGLLDGGRRCDLRLRPDAAERAGTPSLPIQSLVVGRGRVLFSPVDLTTGMLGTNTFGVDGYTPEAVDALVNNVLLWSVVGR